MAKQTYLRADATCG